VSGAHKDSGFYPLSLFPGWFFPMISQEASRANRFLQRQNRIHMRGSLLQQTFHEIFHSDTICFSLIVSNYSVAQNGQSHCFDILNVWRKFAVKGCVAFGSHNEKL
jgi:hypothetical protein